MTEHQKGIIRRHAGVIGGRELAQMAGISYGFLRSWCSRQGISLGMVRPRNKGEDAMVEWLYGWCRAKDVAWLMGHKVGWVRGRLLQLGITKEWYK